MSDPADNEKEKERGFITALRSGNRVSILSALKDIRSSGQVTILPEVFYLLLDQEDEQIYNESVSLLNDLKSNEAVPYLVEALNNPEFQPVRKELVASCWQSGLSYSKHVKIFVDLAVHDSFPIALEAFTVIEDSIGDLEAPEIKKHIDFLKKHITAADSNKQLLLRELIRIMETY